MRTAIDPLVRLRRWAARTFLRPASVTLLRIAAPTPEVIAALRARHDETSST